MLNLQVPRGIVIFGNSNTGGLGPETWDQHEKE